MAKKGREGYLAPKVVLTQRELSEYKGSRQILERFRRLKELEAKKKQLKRLSSQVKYERSRYGKVGKGIAAGFSFLSSPTRALYAKSQPVIAEKKTIQGRSTGKVGRPRGSYNQLYAAYGGVYGFRKAQALERFKERQRILQERAITPQQQIILQQIRARQEAQRRSPESKVYPDTNGDVQMNNIFQEIDELSNIAG